METEGKLNFGYCNSFHDCASYAGYNYYKGYQTPGVWVVGLILAVVAYIIINTIVVWLYCKYFRGKKYPYQQQKAQEDVQALEHDIM